MEIAASKKELKKVVTDLKLSIKLTKATFNNVTIDATEDAVVFTLESEQLNKRDQKNKVVTIVKTVEANDDFQTIKTGSIMLDVLDLYELVKNASDDIITIENESNQTSGKAEAFDTSKAEKLASFEPDELETALNVVASSVDGGKSGRQVLKACSLNYSNDTFNMVATDSHKLGRYVFEHSKLYNTDLTFIFNPLPVLKAKRVLFKNSKRIDLFKYNDSYIFETYNQKNQVITWAVSSFYPGTGHLFDITENNRLITDKSTLLNELKAAKKVVSKFRGIPTVSFELGPKKAALVYKVDGRRGSLKNTRDTKLFNTDETKQISLKNFITALSGSDFSVSFDVTKLIDVVKVVPGEKVIFDCETALRPVKISGITDGRVVTVLAPVRTF